MGKAMKKILLALGAQIPVLGVWKTGILEHSLGAAAVTLGYEAIMLMWAILGKDVWQQLKPEVVQATADWVKMTVQNVGSDFRRRYNRHVLYEHRVFNVRGLRTPGQGALEVEQVFVELNIAPSNPDQASANPLFFKDLTGSQPIWTFLRRFKKKDATALAILGPPGCGKTTLLQHLALIFGANRQRQYHLRAYTPILLFLREHVTAIVQDSLSLADLTQRHFSHQERYPELNPPAHWFPRQLRKGKCLVLLDGLDEVVDADHRRTIAAWVDQQIRNYPRCRFLLTARPQGYRKTPLSRPQVLEVMPFRPDQVGKFVRNWYLANKLIAYGKDDSGVRHDAECEARTLLQRLQSKPRLQELTVNPLLLTMITNVHNYRGVLPERRNELYAEICDVLLGHWQKAKGVSDRLTPAQKREVLQPLAEEMMMYKTRVVSTQEALETITPHLLQVGMSLPEIPAFLKSIQASSGLLLEQEADMWGFAHLTFQEYLCAGQWKDSGKALMWNPGQWQVLIQDSWWHETLRLYAAQCDATPVVNACLHLRTSASVQLAVNLTEEALKLDRSLREAVAKSRDRLVIRLRSDPMTVSHETFRGTFKLNADRRPREYIQNDFVVQGEVVLDRATGLMWQQAGSPEYLTYQEAASYIARLNQTRFAGYTDWRLPTMPELTSLLEPEEQSNGLYLSPVFDKTQSWCWSADRRVKGEGSAESAWVVDFYNGYVDWNSFGSSGFVRAVRS